MRQLRGRGSGQVDPSLTLGALRVFGSATAGKDVRAPETGRVWAITSFAPAHPVPLLKQFLPSLKARVALILTIRLTRHHNHKLQWLDRINRRTAETDLVNRAAAWQLHLLEGEKSGGLISKSTIVFRAWFAAFFPVFGAFKLCAAVHTDRAGSHVRFCDTPA